MMPRADDHSFNLNSGATQPPPSGYRIPLSADSPFPPPNQAGTPPCYDLDGSPLYFGSALMERAVHPCKVSPNLHPYARISYGGQELDHFGRFDLLPYDERAMVLVPSEYGRIPSNVRPVEGGYEEHGGKLFHGVGTVPGYEHVRVPGKCGEHL